MKLFVSGSQEIRELTPDVVSLLQRAVQNGHQILIGDADGVDKLVQEFLSSLKYENVTIYCVEGHCRNNIGKWLVKNVKNTLKAKNFQYYVQKDKAMAEDADLALMIWNGKSNGTLNNVINMLEQNKQSTIFQIREKTLTNIASKDMFDLLLKKINPQNLMAIDKKIRLTSRLKSLSSQHELAF